jgi:hypothetical protein
MSLKDFRYFSHLMGGVIYMTGDAIASVITGDASVMRSAGIFLIGSTLYAWEIQTYFRWIDTKIRELDSRYSAVLKTFMALLYFNPLWIARHTCIVYLVSGRADMITPLVLKSALIAFLVNIPVSIAANFLIQNRTPLRYRFWASAVFSGLMAIYYSMSSTWF